MFADLGAPLLHTTNTHPGGIDAFGFSRAGFSSAVVGFNYRFGMPGK
jgi:hypothetical protein